MSNLWELGGELISDANGTALLECDECPCETAEPCGVCDEGTTPAIQKVTIAGLTGIYAVYNGTYSLPQHFDGSTWCYWILDPLFLDSASFLDAAIQSVGGNVEITVHVYKSGWVGGGPPPPGEVLGFELFFYLSVVGVETVDCSSLGDIDLVATNPAADPDLAGATCSVST